MRAEKIQIGMQGIVFFLCFRNEIVAPGKDFTDGAYLRRNMFDTVDDPSGVITEDDIAVLSHDLYDQCFTAQIAEFV